MKTGIIYITGIGGSGKTTVRAELEKRGYEALEVDGVFAEFFNNKTGERVKQTIDERTPQWWKEHTWIFMPEPLKKLQKRAQSKQIFLCGTAFDEANYLHMFKKVFALVLDNDTLEHRLQTRTTTNWGKSPHELKDALTWNKTRKEEYEKLGATIIDATKPLNEVVDEILKL